MLKVPLSRLYNLQNQKTSQTQKSYIFKPQLSFWLIDQEEFPMKLQRTELRELLFYSIQSLIEKSLNKIQKQESKYRLQTHLEYEKLIQHKEA